MSIILLKGPSKILVNSNNTNIWLAAFSCLLIIFLYIYIFCIYKISKDLSGRYNNNNNNDNNKRLQKKVCERGQSLTKEENEKKQLYGRERYKKIYQKMKSKSLLSMEEI